MQLKPTLSMSSSSTSSCCSCCCTAAGALGRTPSSASWDTVPSGDCLEASRAAAAAAPAGGSSLAACSSCWAHEQIYRLPKRVGSCKTKDGAALMHCVTRSVLKNQLGQQSEKHSDFLCAQPHPAVPLQYDMSVLLHSSQHALSTSIFSCFSRQQVPCSSHKAPEPAMHTGKAAPEYQTPE